MAVKTAVATNPNVAKKLKTMGKTWEASKKQKVGGPRLGEGVYMCRLTGLKIKPNKKKLLDLVSEWTVTRGESKGEKCFRFDTLEREEGIPYTQGYLRALGVEVDEIDAADLPDAIAELLKSKPGARIKVREDGDFTRVDLMKVFAGEDAEEDSDEDDSDKDDDEDGDSDADEKEDDDDRDDTDEKEDDEEEEAEEPEFSKGDDVTFDAKLKGDKKTTTHTGKVTKVKDGIATIKADNGGMLDLPCKDLTKAEGDEESGDDEDADDADEKDDAEEAQDYQPAVDDEITFKKGKKALKGTITKVNAKKETVTVKVGKELHVIPFGDIEEVES